jgi:hypothetical protein
MWKQFHVGGFFVVNYAENTLYKAIQNAKGFGCYVKTTRVDNC